MLRFVFLLPDRAHQPRGGIMNIIRHARVARSLGAEAVVATESGLDLHGRKWFRHDMPLIEFSERHDDDVCVIPDLYSDRVNEVTGRCIVYLQTPVRLESNFDHHSARVTLWTDSPFMLERCTAVFPDREIEIVPNVVDPEAFPFVPQNERRRGMVIFFPRKGESFGDEVFRTYRSAGGRYWKPKIIDRMRFDRMARIFRKPQAFFASADIEGCALPPQESMAAGIVVIGKNAHGANFCMDHDRTAMVANDVDSAVEALVALEQHALRERLARNAYEEIRRFFPGEEPTRFWRSVISGYENGQA